MIKILIICTLFPFLAHSTGNKLNIVVSIPDLGDMAVRIGGKMVKVKSLATGREDLHAVPVRPSFLPLINRADLLISLGLDAEHAWLHALAAEARNSDVMENRPGWVEVSDGISILDIPQVVDRSEGEQHVEGNPHFNIGPQCGKIMAENIFKVLLRTRPGDEAYFKQRLMVYLAELDRSVGSLKKQGAPLKGIAIIGYHPDLAYLAAFYGMEIAGYIEPKAGVSPTASHLWKLEKMGEARPIRMIIHNQSQSPKIPLKVARKLRCPVVEIANAVGAKKEISTWIQLQEYNLRMLIKALRNK